MAKLSMYSEYTIKIEHMNWYANLENPGPLPIAASIQESQGWF